MHKQADRIDVDLILPKALKAEHQAIVLKLNALFGDNEEIKASPFVFKKIPQVGTQFSLPVTVQSAEFIKAIKDEYERVLVMHKLAGVDVSEAKLVVRKVKWEGGNNFSFTTVLSI